MGQLQQMGQNMMPQQPVQNMQQMPMQGVVQNQNTQQTPAGQSAGGSAQPQEEEDPFEVIFKIFNHEK